MKRWVTVLLILSMLSCLCGCSKNSPPPKEPVIFYYPAAKTVYNGTTEVLHPESREGAGYKADIAGLMNLYLKGPVSETLRSPFPVQVTVTRFASTTNTAILELSNEFAQLVGIDLTVACASIARTLFDLTQLDTVQISATDAQLDGQASITLNRNDIYFLDIPDFSDEDADSTDTSGN